MLLEGGPTPAGHLPARALSDAAKPELRRLGVEVRTETMVTDIRPGLGARRGVDDSRRRRSSGPPATRRARSCKRWGHRSTTRAARMVEPDCTIPGHPEVFVLGDAAAFVRRTAICCPGSARSPSRWDSTRPRVIQGDLSGIGRAVPSATGTRVSSRSIGRGHAVADIWKLHFGGFLAWLTWIFVHIFFLIGFRNRVLVLIQWAWSYLTFGRGARITQEEVRRSTRGDAHHRAMPAAAEEVKARADELGFIACGITHPSPPPHGDRLDDWLARGYAGTMRYLHRQAAPQGSTAHCPRGALDSSSTRQLLLRLYRKRGPPEGRPLRARRRLPQGHAGASHRPGGLPHAGGSLGRAGVHRRRPGPRARARPARRTRLDREEHHAHPARRGLVLLHRHDLHRSRAPARHPRSRPIIAAPARAASTPARPRPSSSRECSTPRGASPTSRSSTRDRYRIRSLPGSTAGCSAATSATTSAPGTNGSPRPAAWRPFARARPCRKLTRGSSNTWIRRSLHAASVTLRWSARASMECAGTSGLRSEERDELHPTPALRCLGQRRDPRIGAAIAVREGPALDGPHRGRGVRLARPAHRHSIPARGLA